MTPFGPLYGVTGGSECPKNDQIENLNGHSIETKLGGKVLVFYAYSWAIFRFSWNFLITEKTEIFFSNFVFRIFKTSFLDFWLNFEWNYGATQVLGFRPLDDPPGGHGGH